MKFDSLGRLLPKEYECESVFRKALLRTIDQQDRTISLANTAERVRKNIWWIDPDGSNVSEVVPDIASSLISQGLPWFERLSDLKTALNEVESQWDCYSKFRAAKYFSNHLDLSDKFAKYSALLIAEENRLRAKGSL